MAPVHAVFGVPVRTLPNRYLSVLILATAALAQEPAITTVVGTDPPLTIVQPGRSAFDASGNAFVCDRNYVLKITPAGSVSVFAGASQGGYNGDNRLAVGAKLNGPSGVAVDPAGNVYIADSSNHRVRHVDALTGTITTVAGTGTAGYSGEGVAASAQLSYPTDVALDPATGALFVAEHTGSCRVRKILGGTISTVAGNGTCSAEAGDGGVATSATFRQLRAITVGANSTVYVAAYRQIRTFSVAGGTVGNISSAAGNGNSGTWDGTPTAPGALALGTINDIEAVGPYVYFAASGYRIGRFNQDGTGTVVSVAGSGGDGSSPAGDGGAATSAALAYTNSISNYGGWIYLSSSFPEAGIRRFQDGGAIEEFASGTLVTYGGDDGDALAAYLNSPRKVAFDSAGNMYIADVGNNVIRKVDKASGLITTVAGMAGQYGPPTPGAAPTSTGISINDIAVGPGDYVYIAETNNRVWRFKPGVENMTPVAGDGNTGSAYLPNGDGGPSLNAQFQFINGIAINNAGTVYISDGGHNRVRAFTVGGTIWTVYGTGEQSVMLAPWGIGSSPTTGQVVATHGSLGGASIVRQVAPSNSQLATTAGTIWSSAVSDSGWVLYTDSSGIYKASGGTGTRVAGTGTRGFLGDGGPATSAELADPQGVTYDSQCHIYIADSGNNRIRRVPNIVALTFTSLPAGRTVTVDGTPYTTPTTLSLESGTQHTVGTTAIQGGVDTRHKFLSWSDGGAMTHSITVPGCVSTAAYTATFQTQHALTVNISPALSGTVSLSPAPEDDVFFNQGTVVSLTANAAGGFVFGSYAGPLSSMNPAQVTMSAPRNLTANFLKVQTISFDTLPDRVYGTGAFTVSATATSGLPISFTASGKCTVAGSTVTITGAGTCTITANQAGDGVWAAAPAVQQAFSIAKGDQSITFGTLSDKMPADPPFAVSASTNSGLPVAFTATGQCSILGSTVTILAVGSCTIRANQSGNADWNAAPEVARTFTIAKKEQTITFASLDDKTFGDPQFVIAATATSGLPVTFAAVGQCSVSAATVSITGAGTCEITAAQTGDGNWNAAPAVQRTFAIAKAAQTITFAPLPGRQVTDAPFALTGTASSGLPVQFEAAGPCNLSGNTLTIVGAGTCQITASQPGDSNYSAAASVLRSFEITKLPQTITFAAIADKTVSDAPFMVAVSSSSGLAVQLAAAGNCTATGAQVTITGAGACTITASQPGDGTYAPAAEVARTFAIAKLGQSIDFGPIAGRTYSSAPFAVSATATSGLPVSFSASGDCTITGSSVAVTGVGTCTITASQAGNATYEGAPDVRQSFAIAKATQTITFPPMADVVYGGPSIVLNASASSGLILQSTVSGACRLEGTTALSLTGAGQCSVVASQPGNANYEAAAAVTRTFLITLADQTITFQAIADQVFGATLTPSASASSGLPVTITVVSGPAVIHSGQVTFTRAGTVVLRAVQEGNANFRPAVDVLRQFNVARAKQQISAPAIPDMRFDAPPFAVSAHASSGLPVALAVSGPASLSGNVVTIGGVGVITITLTQGGDDRYEPAPAVEIRVSVLSGEANIVWLEPAPIVYGTPLSGAQLNAVADVEGAFFYDPAPGAILAPGEHILRVTFTPLGPGFQGVASARRLVVRRAQQSIAFAPIGNHLEGDVPFELWATATSGLPVAFRIASGPASIEGNRMRISGVGAVTVVASQAGNSAFEPAAEVTQSFQVTQTVIRPSLTVSASPSYGGSVLVTPAAADGGYTPGTVVQVRAVPASGFEFVAFKGDVAGTNPIQWLTISGNQVAVATFRPLPPAPATTWVFSIRGGNLDVSSAVVPVPDGSGQATWSLASAGGRVPEWLNVVSAGSNLLRVEVIRTVAVKLESGTYTATATLAGPGGGSTLRFVLLVEAPRIGSVVNAGSYRGEGSGGAWVTLFGWNMAGDTEMAVGELQQTLAGTSVTVTDSTGVGKPALLNYASPGQVNLLLPSGLTPGTATLKLTNKAGQQVTATLVIAAAAPGLFSADSTGAGMPAGSALLVGPDGTRSEQALATVDPVNGRVTPVRVDMGAEGSHLFLVLYGTALRGRSSLESVQVRVGDALITPLFAGAQPTFAGLDQINVELPRSLAGRGLVDVTVVADGRESNTLQILIQ